MRGALGAFAVCATLLWPLVGCAVGRSLWTSSDDLQDYRAFRTSGHESVRLARALRYLARHPKGAWADEVRRAFGEEEPRYFERASESRAGTSEYVTDLPHGPHADAAIALLTAFDTHIEDIATAKLLASARRTEARLELASRGRHALGEAILGDVAALLEPGLYGAPGDELPYPVRRALGGLAPPTWGSPEPIRNDDYFYVIPTRLVRESRVASLELRVVVAHGVAVLGRVSGPDLFVHWDEADEVLSRDPTDPRDRARAAAHAADQLDGALEARLPAERCRVASSAPRDVLVRRCDGWEVVVTIGKKAGDEDAIVVKGPVK
jgi:hypothetical protein